MSHGLDGFGKSACAQMAPGQPGRARGDWHPLRRQPLSSRTVHPFFEREARLR